MGEQIDGVTARMRDRLVELERAGDPGRYFLATYLRTTLAVADALDDGAFEDPAWVEWWDAVFADLYLDALAAHRDADAAPPRPWRIALSADGMLPPLAHVLLGMNAHINYDLPQALIGVISSSQFDDPWLMERRRRDHERIDAVLARRVAQEDRELRHVSGPRRLVDRAMMPANRAASRRFLREARTKVWHNTLALHQARRESPEQLRRRVAELEVLSAAKVADLLRPGPVLVRLGTVGFGVLLPPA